MPSMASTGGIVSERAVPSTATILGVVILSQAMTSSGWSTAGLIFWRLIALAAAAAGSIDLESYSTSSSSGTNYEVFLSFRGADTRKGFTDHLYTRLVDAGIRVFRDDENLHAGEEIKQQLIDAIKGSKISIAVFSKDYASSRSCLMEVVQMWECKIFIGQTIIPVFYDITPFNVKRQAGDFKTSFEQHVRDGVNADAIQNWKNVLRKVGGLSGFNRQDINGGHEAELVERVRNRVRQVLEKDDQDVTDKLVGIDPHVQQMMTKLGVVYSHGQAMKVCGEDRRVVVISGMPGVGKTTLAKVVFNKIHEHEFFKGCCFLEGINSQGVVSSQAMLIAGLQKEKPVPLGSSDKGIEIISSLFSRMKVLVVLDDVHEDEHIEALVGKLTWFGPGSRIIVTTNTRNVLKDVEGEAVEEHKLTPMEHDRALQLFRKHAFQGYASERVREYDSLSIDIVAAVGGIPLAIVLWASYLRHQEKEIWREILEMLEKDKGDKVKGAFEARYKSLDTSAKKIFLDIACFFIGKDGRIPSYMWKACGYYPAPGIKQLRDMHWLEDGENNELRMHNLLRDFGRELVAGKALHERCRIWNHSDALIILKSLWGTASAEGIGLTVEEGSTVRITFEKYCQMLNLRYLRLDRASIQGNNENFVPSLRWLDWRECHSIPELCNMCLEELVILDLSRSQVTTKSAIWNSFMKKKLKLKVLNLQGCRRLGVSLNFPAPVTLEMLILEDCPLLSNIGPFISELRNLSSLNLRKCSRVTQLPQELGRMRYLKELLIDGSGIKAIVIERDSLKTLEKLSACDCKELEYISPIGHLTKLKSLALDGAKIWHPETFEFPQNLQRFSLRSCSMFEELPSSIGNLVQLEVMDLSHTKISKLPDSAKHLSNLKTLKMEGTHLQKFPEDIVNLGKLEEIDFSGCRNLEAQDCRDISGLSSLRILRLSSSIVAWLPESIKNLTRLQTLDLLKCNQLQALPELPSSLQSLRWGSKGMTISNLSYLTNLKELLLEDAEHPIGGLFNLKTPKTPDIGWITRLTSLETLELSLSNITNLPGNFSALTQLRELSLSYVKELDLTQLPSSSLLTLRLKHCNFQEPKFSSLRYLSELELDNCHLATIDDLKDSNLLEVLKIYECSSVTNFKGLKELPRLREVEVFPFDPANLSDISEGTFKLYTCFPRSEGG